MPPSEQNRIFISYAHRDGADLARRLQTDLSKNGFEVWLDTQRIPGGAVWTGAIEREIDDRQVMVALLTPGSYESEICRAEQLRCLRKGRRLIPVLAAAGADRPLHLEARQFRDFTDQGSYDTHFEELVSDIRSGDTAKLLEPYHATRVTYLTTPPQVANYLERPDVLRALRDTLFAEDHRQPIAATALFGMGGIGKTVLAKALTEDEVVQQAFPDGIVWITAGKESRQTFIQEMREVAKALGDNPKDYVDETASLNQYRTTIRKKAALIVVDDVWSKADIEPLLAESPRSRFLFTTRDASIGRFVAAREHSAHLLDVAQSRELLASWSNLEVAQLPPEAADLIAECGRLPLALSVLGAMLRDSNPAFWRDTLALLRNVDLTAIQEQLSPGQESFFKAVEVSFQSLAPRMQERYKALVVLLDDVAAPLPVLQTLWKTTESDARRISRHFVDRSLAQRDGAGEAIRLHNLQLDYLRAQYPERAALELIRGAVRRWALVTGADPGQFASQVVGRLITRQSIPSIEQFASGVSQGAPVPWLRPIWPALYPAGTSIPYRPGTSPIRTLKGHGGWVSCVALSADGRLAVSGSEDRTLKVWDVESGRELRSLTGHSNTVFGVAVTPDGKLAISASLDRSLKVWDVERGVELRTLNGHRDGVIGVALSGDGRRAISASMDATLKVWDVESGRELHTLEGHFREVRAVAMIGDGQRAVSASGDGTLKVWDVEGERVLCTLESERIVPEGEMNDVNGVAVTEEGRLAISANYDRTVRLWDVESGREVGILGYHGDIVWGVALTGDGRRAVSASGDNTLKVWDVETGRKPRTLKGHSDLVWAVALDGDGRNAVSASWDKTLKVWDVRATGVKGVAVSGDGRRAITAGEDKTLKVWDVESGRELRTLQGHSYAVLDVALSGDGRRAVSASSDKTLKVWDVESGHELHTLKGHSFWVHGVAMSGDGRQAISASADSTLKVWDVESGRELRTLKGHSDPVYVVALSRDGRRAVSASAGHALKVWDAESGRELRTLDGHADSVRGVALSGDGRRAVSASRDKTLKVWDVESGRELRTLKGHSQEVWRVALSEAGLRAVSASEDHTVKVWDLESGLSLATFTCDAAARCCAFIDDRHVIAGDDLGRVHLLCLEEPQATN